MTPQQVTFADYFARWGLTLPDEAVAHRRNGHLKGAGWVVRFVWRDGETIIFRASHRMTNERLHAISPDGLLTQIELSTPFEFMMIPNGASPEDMARIQHDYREDWQAYSEAIKAAGLHLDRSLTPSSRPAAPGTQMWCIDGGEWQSGPLRPSVT